jgi:hypothetical protein
LSIWLTSSGLTIEEVPVPFKLRPSVAVCLPSILRIVVMSEATQASISVISPCNERRERISEAKLKAFKQLPTDMAHATKAITLKNAVVVANITVPHLWILLFRPCEQPVDGVFPPPLRYPPPPFSQYHAFSYILKTLQGCG